MPTSILVTGGAGYIGSHACKALARAGYMPVVYDNLSRGHRAAVRWGPLVEGDLADRDRLCGAIRDHRVAAVMHFAAYAYVGESVGDPALYYRNNLCGTLSLLEAMRETGVGEIVFSSTCATYGIPDAVPIGESAAQHPVNPYGETKLAIERALHWYGQAYAVRSVSLRYFNAAGADPECEIGEDHEPETHLVPLVLQAALGQRPAIEIYGTDYPTADGTAVRDYIHVHDLASAHLRAFERLRAGGDSVALNLGTGQGHSVRDSQSPPPRPRAAARSRRARRRGGPATRRCWSPTRAWRQRRSPGAPSIRASTRSCARRLPGIRATRGEPACILATQCRDGRWNEPADIPLCERRRRFRRAGAAAIPGALNMTLVEIDEAADTVCTAPSAPVASSEPIRVSGKFFFAGERKHFVKGVTYGPFPIGSHGAPFPEPATVEIDFALMAEAGINTVRVFTAPPVWLLDAAQEAGLKVLAGLPWPQHVTFLDSAAIRAEVREAVIGGVRGCRRHPAIFAYLIGNEIPPDMVRWHGAEPVRRFLRSLVACVKAEHPEALVSYANFPSTEYLTVDFTDFVCFNVYLHDETAFRRYVARLHNCRRPAAGPDRIRRFTDLGNVGEGQRRVLSRRFAPYRDRRRWHLRVCLD